MFPLKGYHGNRIASLAGSNASYSVAVDDMWDWLPELLFSESTSLLFLQLVDTQGTVSWVNFKYRGNLNLNVSRAAWKLCNSVLHTHPTGSMESVSSQLTPRLFFFSLPRFSSSPSVPWAGELESVLPPLPYLLVLISCSFLANVYHADACL